MTENASQVATYQKGMPLFCYQITQHTRVKIHQNIIYIRGKSLSKSCFKKSTQNDNRFHQNGNQKWFRTGDRGFIKNQYLHLLGRADNTFISGGENVEPEEIEDHLIKYSSISSATIVAEKSDQWGNVPVAYLDPYPTISEQKQINCFLKEKISSYKIPTQYLKLPKEFRDNLKVSRKQLQIFHNQNFREIHKQSEIILNQN